MCSVLQVYRISCDPIFITNKLFKEANTLICNFYVIRQSFKGIIVLPQLPSVLRETPPPPLKLNLYGNYSYHPNYRLFIERPHPTLEAESE